MKVEGNCGHVFIPKATAVVGLSFEAERDSALPTREHRLFVLDVGRRPKRDSVVNKSCSLVDGKRECATAADDVVIGQSFDLHEDFGLSVVFLQPFGIKRNGADGHEVLQGFLGSLAP